MNDDLVSNLDTDTPEGSSGISLMLGAFLTDKLTPAVREEVRAGRPLPIRRTVFGTGTPTTVDFTTYTVAPCTNKPAAGRVWFFRSLYAFHGTDASASNGSFNTGYYDQGFSATVAAAAAGTLTVATRYVSSWRIDPAAAWPAGNNLVTITNVYNQTQSYYLPGGTTSPLVVDYDDDLQTPLAQAVISVPAIVGGPAYTINAVGRNMGNNIINPVAELWASSQVPEIPTPGGGGLFIPQPNLSSLILGNIGPTPFRDEFPEMTYGCKGPNTPFMTVRNSVPGNQTVWIARVDDYAIEDVEAMSV